MEDRWMGDKNDSLFCQKGHHISHTFIFLQALLKWSQEIFFKLKIFHHHKPCIRIYLKNKEVLVSSQLHLQTMYSHIFFLQNNCKNKNTSVYISPLIGFELLFFAASLTKMVVRLGISYLHGL